MQCRSRANVNCINNNNCNTVHIPFELTPKSVNAFDQGDGVTRGGVEDTRFEAKAKDTKRKSVANAKVKDSFFKDRTSRGQGQGPRTQPQVFSKKIRLQKSFAGDLQFIGAAKIFDWGRPKPQSKATTSSKIFQRGSFCGTRMS